MVLVDKNTHILETACSILRRQIDKLGEHFAELDKTEDIETVHQIRVVCRRLRETLVFFADFFEPTAMEEWKKATKKLLRKLGEPRDLDVQICFLGDFLSGLNDERRSVRPGIERLLLRLKQRRKDLQKQVGAAVKQFQKKHILINIRLQTEKALYVAETYPAVINPEGLTARLKRNMTPRLVDVQKKMPSLNDPTHAEEQHKLRIAIKKLRYTVEIGDTLLGGSLAEYLGTLKAAQTVLGELHDCDVWLSLIDAFEDEEKQRMMDYTGHTRSFGRLRTGLNYLETHCTEHRGRWHRQAVELMEPWQRENWLQGLAEAAQPADSE